MWKGHKDNRGMSLVELLVGIAVAAVVVSAISAIMFNCLKMYGKAAVTIDLQSEAQLALNQIVDAAMEADGLTISYNEALRQTEYVLFGEIESNAAGDSFYYSGKVVVADAASEKIYLAEFPNGDYAAGDVIAGSEDACITTIVDYVKANSEKFLLASYIREAYIGIVSGALKTNSDGKLVYEVPLVLDISLGFSKNSTSGDLLKQISNKAKIRNALEKITVVNSTGTIVYLPER